MMKMKTDFIFIALWLYYSTINKHSQIKNEINFHFSEICKVMDKETKMFMRASFKGGNQ